MKVKILLILVTLILTTCAIYAQKQEVDPLNGLLKMDYTYNPNLSPMKYGIGNWSINGTGHHRVVVEVSKPSDAVLANVEWRRRDPNPDAKSVLVIGPESKEVNSKAFNITDPTGNVVFEAKTAGIYYIYYLPYIPTSAYFIENPGYFTGQRKSDLAWLNRNNLNIDNPNLNNLPKAKQIEVQARGDFNSMYPMEISVTDNELKEFLNKYESQAFCLFAEDRIFQIRMLNAIPYKWYKSGEVTDFKGVANPSEIYAFQIGVYANKSDLLDIKVTPTDLVGGKSTIKASDIHCINTGGIDYIGKPFTKVINLNKGKVQPLWFYVQMPNAKDTFNGKVKISVGSVTRDVSISIKTQGEELKDGGVSDLWRMSRLSWLDKSISMDKIVPPFKPIKVSGNTASILNRKITFDKLGFPSSIVANKRKLFVSPATFEVAGEKFKVKSNKVIYKTDGYYEFTRVAVSDNLELTVNARLEFDGYLKYNIKLKALKDTTSDVSFSLPMDKKVAKYAMGLGFSGGYAPKFFDWKWEKSAADYMGWVGDYNAGIQLQLTPADGIYRVAGTLNDDALPAGWFNDNKGGISLRNNDKEYMFKAYSGPKNIKAGESVDYNFRLMLTPFKDINPKHWYENVGGPSAEYDETNVYHVHHSSNILPYINYPFANIKDLNDFKSLITNVAFDRSGKINYEVNNLTSKKGSVTVDAECSFNGQETAKNISFVSLKNGEYSFGLYWNYEVKTLRLTSQKVWNGGAEHYVVVDTTIPKEAWTVGAKHKITISWGDNIIVYCDGSKVLEASAKLFPNDMDMTNIELSGDFDYSSVSLSDGDNIILEDNFSKVDKNGNSIAKIGGIGKIDGSGKILNNTATFKADKEYHSWNINIYYSSAQLTDHAAEIWALRSLGDEIYDSQGFIYTAEGAKKIEKGGGGHPWLYEHLQENYVPMWHCDLTYRNEDHCASIGTKYVSRWMNYYVNGMDFLMKATGINGLYLDGIGYDRETMKRMAKVMYENDPNYRINYHSGDNFVYINGRANVASNTMEHFPYITRLWIGEMFDFESTQPDYWFTEMSGIPFGLTNEMLNYQNGGNMYRGMVYGMTGRFLPSYVPMIKYWKSREMHTRKFIGYWDEKPVVKVVGSSVKLGNDEILASAFAKKGSIIIAVASWKGEDVNVNLQLDYKALGLNKDKVKIIMPEIKNFQEYKELDSLDNLQVKSAKGFILEVTSVK